MKKYIILIIVLILLIIIACGAFVFWKYIIPKKESTYSIINSYDNSFSIEVDNVFEFAKQSSSDDYDLVLKSETYNSEIYVSSFGSSRVRSIEDVLKSDKEDFSSKFQAITNLSEFSTFDVSGNKVYEYHFTSSNRYIQNYYIVLENKVYVFDFDIDKNNDYEYSLEDYTEEIIKSFKVL